MPVTDGVLDQKQDCELGLRANRIRAGLPPRDVSAATSSSAAKSG